MKIRNSNLAKADTKVGFGFFASNQILLVLTVCCCVALVTGCNPPESPNIAATSKTGQGTNSATQEKESKTSTGKIETRFHFFYRPDIEEATGDAKSIKIRIPITDAGVDPDSFNQSRIVEFPDLKCEVKAAKNKVTVLVATKDGKKIARQSFEIKDSLSNYFGEFGFTGHNFFYHPAAKSDLKYWAEIEL